MPKTVAFLVDGFNVYHSLREIEALTGNRVKWLDLNELLRRHLSDVRSALGGDRVEIGRIYYFSALAKHLTTVERGIVDRHCAYIDALENTGVEVVLAHFKGKDVKCPHCKRQFRRYEEKETDVAIALKLIEVFARSDADTAVLVSGDTDLLPAMRTSRKLFADRKIGVAFPFNRHTAQMQQEADYSFHLRQKEIQRAQFPATIALTDGTMIQRPGTW
jgi:uncharacterized LabA/DUF88 family protein